MENNRSQGSSTPFRRAATDTTLVTKGRSRATSRAASHAHSQAPSRAPSHATSRAHSRIDETGSPSVKYKKEWKQRRRTWLANTLILFNVYGIPLSFGPYLEYYYNTWFPTTSLLQLALIIAFQLLGINCTEYFGVRIARSKHWRAIFILISVIVIGCQIAIPWYKQWWYVLLMQGIVLGTGLGLLRTMSRLHLATHYKNNIPLASTQSGAAAMGGALVYTIIAYTCLYQKDSLRLACEVNLGATILTLFPTFGLVHRSKLYRVENERSKSIADGPGSKWFLTGYLCLFVGIFVWPTFFVLFLCSPPSNRWPEDAAPVLLFAYAVGSASAAYSTNRYARRYLGPVNAFTISAIVAGLALINPAWVPYFWVSSASYVVLGFAIGPVLALHIKAITVFHASHHPYAPDMLHRITLMSALIGVFAFTGIVATAAVVQSTGNFKIPLMVAGCLMVMGGVLMMVGRFKKSRPYKMVI